MTSAVFILEHMSPNLLASTTNKLAPKKCDLPTPTWLAFESTVLTGMHLLHRSEVRHQVTDVLLRSSAFFTDRINLFRVEGERILF